jgi:hypothetical protein
MYLIDTLISKKFDNNKKNLFFFDSLKLFLFTFKMEQKPGDYIINFPNSYHQGFNNGFNCNQAVNFSTFNSIEKSLELHESEVITFRRINYKFSHILILLIFRVYILF